MRRLSTVLLIAGTLVLAACGGSDDESSDSADTTATTAPAEVTKASYIAEGDAFCKKSNAIARTLNQRAQAATASTSTDEARLAALAPILKEGYAVQVKQSARFAEIPGPAADQAFVAKLRAAYQRQTALVGEFANAAGAGDVAAASKVIAQQDTSTKRARKLAQDYGFKECGSGKNEAG